LGGNRLNRAVGPKALGRGHKKKIKRSQAGVQTQGEKREKKISKHGLKNFKSTEDLPARQTGKGKKIQKKHWGKEKQLHVWVLAIKWKREKQRKSSGIQKKTGPARDRKNIEKIQKKGEKTPARPRNIPKKESTPTPRASTQKKKNKLAEKEKGKHNHTLSTSPKRVARKKTIKESVPPFRKRTADSNTHRSSVKKKRSTEEKLSTKSSIRKERTHR